MSIKTLIILHLAKNSTGERQNEKWKKKCKKLKKIKSVKRSVHVHQVKIQLPFGKQSKQRSNDKRHSRTNEKENRERGEEEDEKCRIGRKWVARVRNEPIERRMKTDLKLKMANGH